MSDKLKELTPIKITLEDGESPTANKLESSFDQVANAMNVIERAIGDTWNQNSETGGPLDSDPNHIANISRAIGNMSSTNPSSLGGNELSVTGEAVPEGKKIFALNNAPTDPTNQSAIVFSNPTGVFDTLVATLALVDSTGDYFIEANGLVHTFSLTNATHEVAYDYTTIADSYSGATYNVMPDPAQGTKCNVVASGAGFDITLPVEKDSGSKNYNQQLLLPTELSALTDADEIPAGYIYVWDHAGGGGQRANSIVEGLTFKVQDSPSPSLATFYVEGVDLAVSASEPNRYSIICAGTKIAKTLRFLRDYLMSHRHDDNLSAFLNHGDLLGSDDPVSHGVVSSIVGIDDEQALQNKTLVDAIIYDSGAAGILIKSASDEIVLKDPTDSVFKYLSLLSIPDLLTGKSAQYVIDANDGVTPIPADSVAEDGSLYPLGTGNKFPNAVLNTGSGNGLDADTVDGAHLNDTIETTSNLWSASKTASEVGNIDTNPDHYHDIGTSITSSHNEIASKSAGGSASTTTFTMVVSNLAGNTVSKIADSSYDWLAYGSKNSYDINYGAGATVSGYMTLHDIVSGSESTYIHFHPQYSEFCNAYCTGYTDSFIVNTLYATGDWQRTFYGKGEKGNGSVFTKLTWAGDVLTFQMYGIANPGSHPNNHARVVISTSITREDETIVWI